MKESLIEDEGVKYASRRGWLVLKQSSPANRGDHDQIHFKKGIAFTIEYKTTGKKATAKQRERAGELKAAGIPCRCIDNVSDARRFINYMELIAEETRSSFRRCALATAARNIISFDP